jgi:hypothetical protein
VSPSVLRCSPHSRRRWLQAEVRRAPFEADGVIPKQPRNHHHIAGGSVVYLVACNDRVNDRLETVGGST